MHPPSAVPQSELKPDVSIRSCRSYLLVVQQIPFYRDTSGCLFVGKLWWKDLGMHLDYLDHLMVAAPVLDQPPPPEAVRFDQDPRMSRMEIIELPEQRSTVGALKVMPTVIARLWKAVRRSHTVHTAVAGWPIPMGWIITPMARLQRKPYVVVVESAPWRLQKGLQSSFRARLKALSYEALGRCILRRAALSIFTHDGYRQSMLAEHPSPTSVIPASWIDESDILSRDQAQALWRRKNAPGTSVRILFAGRLLPEKGLLVLFEAIQQLYREREHIQLDILGEGPLRETGEKLSQQLGNGPVQVSMLGTVQYGVPLLELLRTYHAVLVPSISDEQPRIVFDAYSQAVPIIASDTEGLRSCVYQGETGVLVAPSNAHALAEALRRQSTDREELARMGLHSLTLAHNMTHQHMHGQRAALLRAMHLI